MKTYILYLFLFSSSIYAQNKEFNIRPNREYMNFVLKGYLSWYKDRFLVDPLFHPKKEYLNKVLSLVDALRIPEHVYPMDQVLFGQGVNSKGEIIYRFRVYIHPEARTKDEWFVEWEPGKELCFLYPQEKNEINFKNLSAEDKIGVKFFKYDCQRKKNFIGVQYLSQKIENVPYLNAISGTSYKVYGPEGLEENFIESRDLILNVLPKEIHSYSFVHMLNLMRPLQKISFGKNKEVIIFYP